MTGDAAAYADRRFYIHERSFALLCRDFVDHHSATLEALTAALLGRMARHHLVVNAEELGFVGSESFRPLVRVLESVAAGRLERLFRGLVYVPAEVAKHDELRHVLGADERISANCWEGGYFTFATGSAAAARMFAESGSLRLLRVQVRQEPHRYPDLTMISGRRLYPFSAEAGTGPGSLRRYPLPAQVDGHWPRPQYDAGQAVHAAIAGMLPGRPWSEIELDLINGLEHAASAASARLVSRLVGSVQAVIRSVS